MSLYNYNMNSNYTVFEKRLSNIANKSFDKALFEFSLENILTLSEFNDQNNSTLKHSNCLCGHKIHIIFVIKYTTQNKDFHVGYCCAQHFYDQFLDQCKQNCNLMSKINDYREKWEYLMQLYKFKTTKRNSCKVCDAKWTHNRCFYRGLCKDCKQKQNEVGNVKVVLPKYKNKTISYVYKFDKDYVHFCIQNKTRQHNLFEDYAKYWS